MSEAAIVLAVTLVAACGKRESSASAPSATSSAEVPRAGKPWRTGEVCSKLTLAKRGEDESGPIQHFAWSPDHGRFVTSSTTAADTGTYRLWDAAKLRVIRTQKVTSHSGGVGTVRKARAEFAANGQVVAVAVPPKHEAWIWHVERDNLVHLKAELSLSSTLLSPDGRRALLISAWGGQKLFDTHTGVAGAAVEPGRGSSTMGAIDVWVPGGELLVTSDAASNVYLWELGPMTVKTLTRDPNTKTGLGLADIALDKDGDTLVIAHGSGTVELWSLSKGKRIRTLATGAWEPKGDFATSHGIALSPNGRSLLVQLADGSAKMWSMLDTTKSITIATPSVNAEDNHQLISAHAEFSADGAYFATIKHRDVHTTLATIYEHGEPPREVMQFEMGYPGGGEEWVGFVGWRDSGHRFVRVVKGNKREEWDPTTKTRARNLPRHDEHPSIRLRANGDLVVTRIADGERLMFREVRGGRLLVVDDRGCVSGAIEEGRSELRDENGAAPSVEAVRLAHRTGLTF